MESFLNLLWVAIAAGAFCLWRMRWISERPGRRRDPLREWTAFACALVILFFAVSLTDDLHSELVLFDECAGGRRHSLALVCPHHHSKDAAFANSSGTALLPRIKSLDSLQKFAAVLPANRLHPSSVTAHLAAGRAPPTVPV